MKQALVVGDRVRYTRRFLKSIMSSPTSVSWQYVGRVVEIGQFVSVLWDGDTETINGQAVVFERVNNGFYIDDSSLVELNYEYIYGLNGMSKRTRHFTL